MRNIFEVANITKRRGIIVSRLERIKREGSPNYEYPMPATAAGAVDTMNPPIQFPDSRKYQPLDSIEIVNNEVANPITVTINQHDAYYCPAGTIRIIHGKGIALWSVDTTNNGAAITTLGLIHMTLKKEAMTIDKWAGMH